MDFQLSEEQVLLRDTTRDMLSRKYDAETRLKTIDSDLGWSRDVWKQLAEVGVLGLGFDEDAGGQIEVQVVLTEVGRRLAPEPVLHAALGPGALIAEVGNEQQRAALDDVAAGERLLAFAHLEPGMRAPRVTVATHAVREGDSWAISGSKNPVLAGDCADTLVVSATLPDGGTGLFLVDATAAKRIPFRTFDGQRGAQIDFDNVAAEPLGEGGDASEAISRALVRVSSGLSAEALGAMEESLRLTSEYLTQRKQFGVTLSKFQTLTQRAADMYVSLELARSMVLYAAMSVADGNLDDTIAARTKLQIGRSGRHIAQESIQLHGGIGVTAEHPISHYAARLTAIDHTLGSATDQLHVLVAAMGDYEVVAI